MLVIGDSLALGIPADLMIPFQIVNFGISGDSTQHVLQRMTVPKLATLLPMKVLIVVGTNNLSYGAPPCAIVAGITQIVAKAKELWPTAQIVFLEIPPRGVAFKDRNDDRMAVNVAVRSISGLKTINADAQLTCGWSEPCGNYHADRLHITTGGYTMLTKIIKDKLF